MSRNNIVTVSMKDIVPDPNQPRTEFEPAALKRLEQSIAAQGILQPLALEKLPGGKFLLVDGERRYRASKNIGLKEVPAIVYDSMNDKERIATRFHLQEMHAGWSAFDKAKAIATMQAVNNMSAKDIAEILGLSTGAINEYLLLLSLSKRSIKTANEHKLPFAYLSAVASAIRPIDKVSTRNQLEDALIERVKSGVIRRATEIFDFKSVIRSEDPKMINLIISKPNLTAKEILESAGLAASKNHRAIMHQVAYLANALVKGEAAEYNREMAHGDEQLFERLRDAIDTYLTTSGVAIK